MFFTNRDGNHLLKAVENFKNKGCGYCCPSCGNYYDAAEIAENNFKACKTDYDVLNAEYAFLEVKFNKCIDKLETISDMFNILGRDAQVKWVDEFLEEVSK
jgi:CxxC motif-containing protein